MYTNGVGPFLDDAYIVSSVTKTITPNGRKVPRYHRTSKEFSFCRGKFYTSAQKCRLEFETAHMSLRKKFNR